MECSRHRVSFATWRLHVFRQLLVTSHQSHITQRSIASSAELHNEASSEIEATVNTETKRIPPSQRLRQSPLITHPRNEPKKNRKRLPTREDLEPLAKNPWAVALASPVRLCSITGAKLPRALLGEWGLVQGPNMDRFYMLPVGLLKDSLAGQDTPGSTSMNQDKSPGTEASTQYEKEVGNDPGVKSLHNKQPGRQLVLRMVDRLPLLRKISPPLERGSSKRPAVAKLLPFRWKHPYGPITAREEKSMVWRENMPEYVLRHMQMDVARKLERTCKRHSRIGAANGVWNVLEMQEYSDAALEDALRRLGLVGRAECGAVLLLGPFPEGTSFSETVMLPQAQSTIPVFDISSLLSEPGLQMLRGTAAPQFQHTALLFRPDDRMSIETMLSLWKLKQFLAEGIKFGV